MKVNWYKRKDGTHVMKQGNWKVLEIFKRPGKFWACFIFKEGKPVMSNGYFGSSLPKRYHAVRWGVKKAKELKILV